MTVRPTAAAISEEYVEQRFPEVVDRIREENPPIRRRTAVRWLREALHFLDACAESDEPLAPSKRVDRAWHEFILHTLLYTRWCEQRYGEYIHHTPSAQADPLAYRRAYAMLRARHGKLDKRIWPDPRGNAPAAGASGVAACGWRGDSGGGADGGGASCGGGGCGGGGGGS
jgi:hypothetical protein